MPITINGAGTVTGITAGGLPDSSVLTADIADANITAAKLSGAQTGTAPIYGCRAWVNFDGTRNEADTGASTNGANVKIRASGNVTSVLKNGTGDYTVNFTTALADANYASTVSAGRLSDKNTTAVIANQATYAGNKTVSAFRVVSQTFQNGNMDVDMCDVAIFR
jgi:hypothetical protein